MKRTKFDGLVYNGYKYPKGYMVPGGHLPYPPDSCIHKSCIKIDRGIPVIDYGCCTSCEHKCFRADLWKKNGFAEYKTILKYWKEWKNGR